MEVSFTDLSFFHKSVKYGSCKLVQYGYFVEKEEAGNTAQLVLSRNKNKQTAANTLLTFISAIFFVSCTTWHLSN